MACFIVSKKRGGSLYFIEILPLSADFEQVLVLTKRYRLQTKKYCSFYSDDDLRTEIEILDFRNVLTTYVLSVFTRNMQLLVILFIIKLIARINLFLLWYKIIEQCIKIVIIYREEMV